MRPDVATLRRLLRYEPETGKFYWRPRLPSDFTNGGHSAEHNAAKWNARLAGREALTAPSRGYLVGGILGQQYGAHQVAWAIFHGEWPSFEVDHENHRRADNRIANLRDVTPGVNSKNQTLRCTSKTGAVGVHWHTRSQRWVAKIHVNGRTRHLGNFADFDAAVTARSEAQRELGFHPNHGRKLAA